MILPLPQLSRASVWLQSFEIENDKIFHMGNKDEEFCDDLDGKKSI
jgi:hypothetical protein